ncbi:MAG: hypothetical protein FWG64_03600 [Firmicutes bacterium]|nr:hypothetical protein [Bacillota bacterium]
MKKVIITGALALTLALGAGGFTAFASGFDDDTATVEVEAFGQNGPNLLIPPEGGGQWPSPGDVANPNPPRPGDGPTPLPPIPWNLIINN